MRLYVCSLLSSAVRSLSSVGVSAQPTRPRHCAPAGATFGGFISECQPPSAPGPDGRHFYGNGESFLWRVEPLTDLPPLPRPSMGEPPTCLLETFGWTGANTYFALSHREHLALGSGGHFGLWIDADLRHGSSGASDTYGDPSPWTRHSAARALNGAASQLHA
mmetsp:Transcript_8430/g.27217  ORF Transcript_8430/g.27217 Transcript_8430/m.27217 type:complete len:163 (-) Transcript_8430:154-642(-)